MQVDSALLGHPRVAEAVSFAAPDEKYGEVVAAAVVLTQLAGNDTESIVADIRKFAATKLAKFKVCESFLCSQTFVCCSLPIRLPIFYQIAEMCPNWVTCWPEKGSELDVIASR